MIMISVQCTYVLRLLSAFRGSRSNNNFNKGPFFDSSDVKALWIEP